MTTTPGDTAGVDEVRKSFHVELDVVRQEMVQMSAMVTEAIPRATEALLSGDLASAQQIIEDDDPLDAKSIELEDRCYQILALQQPVAGDLRSIITAIRMVSEIERVGSLRSPPRNKTRAPDEYGGALRMNTRRHEQ